MKKTVLFILLLMFLLFSIPMRTCAEEAEESGVKAYVLMEPRTETVLEEQNGREKLNVGYLSKLMALYVIALDIETGKYTLDKELTASDSVTGTKGSVVWLRAGDRMTVDELLKSVIIGNANDAMTVLAEASEQSVENFVKRMNMEAFDLGLRDSVFYSPYGYYDEREYSTACDIAVICSRLSGFDFLRPYFHTWRDFVREQQTELVNENVFARTYEPMIGFKASHSDQSGYCAAEGAADGDSAYISVVLGAESDEVSFALSKKLLKSGFRNYRVVDASFPDEMIMPVHVSHGRESAVELALQRSGLAAVRVGSGELTSIAVLPAYLEAPVTKGQRVGTVGFYSGKTLVCETDVIVKTSVAKMDFKFVFGKMLFNLLE